MLRKTIIPLGGYGTRLRPLTVETSKALVRFLNRPLIEFTIVKLARQGIKEFYMGVSGYINYKEVYDYFGEGLKIRAKYNIPDVKIRFQPNEDSVGNADSIRIIIDYYDINEPVLVVQGDLLFDIDLKDFWKFHASNNSFMSIAIKYLDRDEELVHFGIADIEKDYRIKKFVEKPRNPREAPSRYVNTGIYLLSEEFRGFLCTDPIKEMRYKGMMDFGQHIIPLAIELTQRVYAYILSGYWFDIGTPERYLEATFYLLRILSPEDLEAKPLTSGVRVQGKSRESEKLHKQILSDILNGYIKTDGEILIGRHVKIGKGVLLSDAVIDNYSIVDSDVSITRSVIMDRCRIGSKTHIENSIVGRHVKIGKNVKLINSVVSDDTIIGDNAVLINTKVWPHKEIPRDVHIENLIYS